MYISADLSRASSVLDSASLPTASSSFHLPPLEARPRKRTSVQPAQVSRQLESRNPTLRAPRQLESRIWVPGCLNHGILSSYLLL